MQTRNMIAQNQKTSTPVPPSREQATVTPPNESNVTQQPSVPLIP
jgi:hypothetical protein